MRRLGVLMGAPFKETCPKPESRVSSLVFPAPHVSWLFRGSPPRHLPSGGGEMGGVEVAGQEQVPSGRSCSSSGVGLPGQQGLLAQPGSLAGEPVTSDLARS